jgi:flagellar hook capping protein FlgD/GEVED domain-containing protein
MRFHPLRWAALFFLLWLIALPTPGRATDVDGPDDCQNFPVDFGDAPEGVQAYPGVIGHFPTCSAPTAPGTIESACLPPGPLPGPTGFVAHVHTAATGANYWLGCALPGVPPYGIDGENDGKVNDTGGPTSACNPAINVDCFETAFGMTFGQDECYGSTDAGVASPISFSTCAPSNVTFTVSYCGTAVKTVTLNVLVDWNQDGDWNDNFQGCAGVCVSEWAVQNAQIRLQPGCNTITSPTFISGPTPGRGWLRITLSDEAVPPDFTWNGSVSVPGQMLHNGETEDYPVKIQPPQSGCPTYEDWGDAPEMVQAYPGVMGNFPTCSAPGGVGTYDVVCAPRSTPPGPTGFVRHVEPATSNVGFWLGCGDPISGAPGVDSETDGKMNDTGAAQSFCNPAVLVDGTEFFGMTWGQDESYGDGVDAGVAGPTLKFKTCSQSTVAFSTFNCKAAAQDVFLNILVDMNQDGDWNDNILCGVAGGQCAYEWAVKNVPIVLLPGCQNQVSPAFQMGPRPGPGWMRITLTTNPVADDFPWNGSAGPGGDGFFLSGETEDYPVMIRPDIVGVDDDPAGSRLSFAPLAPNPAGSQVVARFTLPQAADVSLSAYDVSGRKLANLTSGRLEAGEHRVVWNFTDSRGRTVPAGYYIVKLRVGDQVMTQRGIRVR